MRDVMSKYIKKVPKSLMIVYGVSFCVLIIAFIIVYFTIGKQLTAFVSDPKQFEAWLESYKNYSAVLFVAIRAFQTVIKIIPAEPLEIASGYAFGTYGGLFLCSVGSLIGTLIILALSRFFGRKFVNVFVNEEEIKSLSVIVNKNNRRLFLCVFYLIPVTPKDIFTYVAGITDINIAEFLIITTIMRIPSIITSTICGNALGEKNIKLAIIVFVATAVVSVICGIIYKKRNKSISN